MSDKLLVIYDGDCRVCRFGIEVIRVLDLGHALEFCPFGNPIAERRLAGLPPDERYICFHVAAHDELHSGTQAAKTTLEALPLGRIVTALGLHHAYPLIVRSRGLLGRFVPDVAAVVTCGGPTGNGHVPHGVISVSG